MTEYVEVLSDIAYRMVCLSAELGFIGFVLLLLLLFKNMGGKK